ncbi:hypothetical protein [Bradyrhizobium sp. B120]|uniref:hypothetical protein n=1 Tax=Bradyrhizobium sp. B120 TaxID=3410088 RepID=UPI003B97E939
MNAIATKAANGGVLVTVLITSAATAKRIQSTKTLGTAYLDLNFAVPPRVHHPSGDDLSVCLVSFDPKIYKFHFIPKAKFLTREIIDGLNDGPGAEVFVVGRFVSHEGKQQNRPTAGFGFIGEMPFEPVVQDDGFKQESFLVGGQ